MSPTAANICTINDFLNGEIDLCSPPEIFMRITQALDDPMKNAKDTAGIIEQDPSLSARMLKIVNSAFFGFPATIKTIDHAISILGDREIRMLVMTTSVVDKFSSMPNSILDMREFWAHSLKTALFAKFLADNHPKKRQLASVFISGLLHDIGRLILYTKAPDLARAAALLAKSNQLSEIDAEASIFGFNHAQLGGALLEMWQIPASIQNATTFHHQPELAPSDKDETNITYLANKLTHIDTTSEEMIDAAKLYEDQVWEHIDMPFGIVTSVSGKVNEQFNQTYSLFFS
jgi:HD-like signal output (HDOD) protein